MYNQTMFALAIFVCLYVCQSFQISSLFHRKLQTSNLKMASEASEQQYSFFVENNLNQGQAWKGLQAGYDPQDDEVEDYMYCEQLFDFMTPAQDEITQINTYVRGEIRADCEVCFDSEQVKSKEMPYKYKLGTLNGIKCCQNVSKFDEYIVEFDEHVFGFDEHFVKTHTHTQNAGQNYRKAHHV